MHIEKYDPKKHEWRGNGWRHHVPIYIGRRDIWGKIKGEIRCSEKECELNVN